MNIFFPKKLFSLLHPIKNNEKINVDSSNEYWERDEIFSNTIKTWFDDRRTVNSAIANSAIAPNGDIKRRYNTKPKVKKESTLQHDELDAIISWFDNGMGFIIRDELKFVNEVLKENFRHKNLSSFLRQLNIYGFKKITTGSYKAGFYHPQFKRGRIDLMHMIERVEKKKKIPGQSRKFALPENDEFIPMLPERGINYYNPLINKQITLQDQFKTEKKLTQKKAALLAADRLKSDSFKSSLPKKNDKQTNFKLSKTIKERKINKLSKKRKRNNDNNNDNEIKNIYNDNQNNNNNNNNNQNNINQNNNNQNNKKMKLNNQNNNIDDDFLDFEYDFELDHMMKQLSSPNLSSSKNININNNNINNNNINNNNNNHFNDFQLSQIEFDWDDEVFINDIGIINDMVEFENENNSLYNDNNKMKIDIENDETFNILNNNNNGNVPKISMDILTSEALDSFSAYFD